MSASEYRIAPDPAETGWPKGVKYIIGNEGCERFSFYGMKSILQVHLTALFVMSGVEGDVLAEQNAQAMVHLFIAGVYAFPMIGAIWADRILGKYRTIIALSLVYCAGHAVLSVADDTLEGMLVGLALIAVGSGGIKPCVSAHVGDQFGAGNWNLVSKVFQAFYFIINFGSFFSTIMIPWTRTAYGASVAFAIPGVLMFIATVFFWMGRKVFVHVPGKPAGKLGLLDALSSSLLFLGVIGLPMFFTDILSTEMLWAAMIGSSIGGVLVFNARQRREEDDGFLAVLLCALQRRMRTRDEQANTSTYGSHWLFGPAAGRYSDEVIEGPVAVVRIISVFFLVSVFWALFDQHSSSWIRQAQRMDRHLDWLGMSIDLLPSQIAALNPLMVMMLIPLNNWVIYPGLERLGMSMAPLRRMTIGMFMASAAFVCVAMIQQAVDAGSERGEMVHVIWQVIPYLVMTQAEVMVSVTGLEFAYTQAPKRMKSTVMGFWLLCVAFGNKLVVFVTGLEGLDLANFFWLFSVLMAAAAVLFAVRARFYTYRDYSQ